MNAKRRCLRCADPIREGEHCFRCAREVAVIIEADTKRRKPRFVAKELTGSAL